MLYALIASMAFQNASRRDNAHQFIVTRLTGLNTWGPVEVADLPALSIHDAPAPTVRAEFRFVTLAERDSFYTDLVAQVSGAQGPVVGSWIARHNCFHDEGGACVETDRVDF
jgi:hypothetical protein